MKFYVIALVVRLFSHSKRNDIVVFSSDFESEFCQYVRVVRCQGLLMFEHVERLDASFNDAPDICPPLVLDGRTNISLLTQ